MAVVDKLVAANYIHEKMVRSLHLKHFRIKAVKGYPATCGEAAIVGNAEINRRDRQGVERK